MTSYDTPVILITGATGSIGSEIAHQALEQGWRVVIHGRSESSVTKSLQAHSSWQQAGAAAGIASDFRVDGAIAQLVERAHDVFGRLDAVVDCMVTAPEGVIGTFAESNPGAYGELMEWSVVCLQRLAHVALPLLKASRGCLVAFASDAGVFSAPRQALLGAARAATIGFVRNLAMEVARYGVRVNCIAPGFIAETRAASQLSATSSQRLEKARSRAGLGLPTAKDIAPMVLFLCGDQAKCITGQVISINGGVNA